MIENVKKRGGKRVGAGRPVGGVSKKRQELQELITESVTKRCLDNLTKLADGVMVSKVDKSGNTSVYLSAPDYNANAYLLDQKFGKARQKIDANLEGGIMLVVNDLTSGQTVHQPKE